ncbi:hypothetical protein [Ferroacidibacillus organovorans]|uniref:Uncharacterized protein n=1 Tax=Ferroacidibacillus organovorans TaxID=1765683 RepID=A0A853KE46_9BACL|nr:hypothetical protein [Ferroacidibacillus organovorans]KYP79888.1 hypothetical protein AYJ22_03035 [Ferroacidibacillus organovorans]OAG94634.1 hypothetical protein AYW79_04580 [Ferroacidibacillus organovorans]
MLYLALPSDLRERYKGSVWLAYAQKIEETEFHAEDTLVVCEWMFAKRDVLMQALNRVRNKGARVVFIGSSAHETEDFKRELCVFGIYDFLFVAEELVLQDLDKLLEHKRSVEDVAMYLSRGETGLAEPPKLVDVFSAKDEPFTWAPLRSGVAETNMARFDALIEAQDEHGKSAARQASSTRLVRKFVWPDPSPVRVRILGDRGCGKSFVALQVAALCHQSELPAAVVEDNPGTLSHWCDESFLSHVYASEPPQGYRVILDTRQEADSLIPDADLTLWVTWPEMTGTGRTLRAMRERGDRKTICLVNHHTPGVLLTSITEAQVVCVPHEPRQFHAIRMKTPLVTLDPNFGKWWMPIVDQISACFVDPNRQGMEGGVVDASVAGV